MTTRTSTSPRTFLGNQIQRLREEKGWTREQLSRKACVSDSLVRAWERGRRVPQPDDLERLDTLFATKQLLTAIRNDLIHTVTPMEWLGAWMAAECKATTLWSCHLVVIPGLLQTEDYARVVLLAAKHLEDIEDMVAARMRRQQILEKEEDPPMVVALLAESTLWYNIGGAQVMHGQLVHLTEMAKRENVIVQVIPNSAAACVGFTGPFVVAGFHSGDGVAYVDNALSGQVVEDGDDIGRLRRMFDTLRAAALTENDSIELIERAAKQWMPSRGVSPRTAPQMAASALSSRAPRTRS